MVNFMKNSITMLENLVKTGESKINQIVFILSDGRFNKDVRVFFNMLECTSFVFRS